MTTRRETPPDARSPERPKRVLFAASVKRHFYFHVPFMQWLKQRGWEVHACALDDIVSRPAPASGAEDATGDTAGDPDLPGCDRFFDLSIRRSPFDPRNLRAYREIKAILERGDYDLISCHTPVCGILTRVAARGVRRRGTVVMYTAHGFHFYEGASLANRLIAYPSEKLCAPLTDALVTINEEDFEAARNHLRARRIFHVHGVGTDTEAIAKLDPDIPAVRAALGVPDGVRLLISVGELNVRKNHAVLIEALRRLTARGENRFFCVICGEGAERARLEARIASGGLSERVKLLGWRNDVPVLTKTADIFLFPSLQEGLPKALMDAMAAGLPAVCSNARGNRDLIRDGEGGFLLRPDDADGFADALSRLIGDDALRAEMGRVNLRRVARFDTRVILEEMAAVLDVCLADKSPIDD